MNRSNFIPERVFFDDMSLEEAAQKIKELSQAKAFSYVVTPNVDHLARIFDKGIDQELISIYQEADMSLCDSKILEKMLKIKGKDIKEAVPGSTLTEYLFSNTIVPEDKVLIIGVNDKYINHLRRSFPTLNIKHINPSMGFINKREEVEELIAFIRDSQANYIFLSVGSPRQEVLASKIKRDNKASGVALCVGASVLFMVGAEKRAPVFIQNLHLEWLYRMWQNPKRLSPRYFKNFIKLPLVLKNL
jgi:exopolysaccharide biosynthesis WecB/TagA/CpsF family protein